MNDAFINMLHASVENKVRKEAEERGQLTLGMLKAELDKCDSQKLVVFDNAGSPSGTNSYRGFYDQLAIDKDNVGRTVEDILSILKEATGATYTGYKGGEFTMTDYTMVWQSEYGTASGLAIIGVDEQKDKVVIITKNTYEESF